MIWTIDHKFLTECYYLHQQILQLFKNIILTHLFKPTFFSLLYRQNISCVDCIPHTHSKNISRFSDIHSIASISHLCTQLPLAAFYRDRRHSAEISSVYFKNIFVDFFEILRCSCVSPPEHWAFCLLTSGCPGPSESGAELWCKELLLTPAAACDSPRPAGDPWSHQGKPPAGSWCWCHQRWSEGV